MLILICSLVLVILAFLGPTIELLWKEHGASAEQNPSESSEVSTSTDRKMGLNNYVKVALTLLFATLVVGVVREIARSNANSILRNDIAESRKEVTTLTSKLTESQKTRLEYSEMNDLLIERINLLKDQNVFLSTSISNLQKETAKIAADDLRKLILGTWKRKIPNKPETIYFTFKPDGTYKIESVGGGFLSELAEWFNSGVLTGDYQINDDVVILRNGFASATGDPEIAERLSVKDRSADTFTFVALDGQEFSVDRVK